MDKKKVLLVSNGFYPEISPRSFRATELAKELYRKGHSVTVYSKHRDHDYSSFLKEYPITFKMWRKPFFPELKSVGISFLDRLLAIIKRILGILVEYPAIMDMLKVKSVLNNEENYDLLISFAVPYPVHWGAAWSRSGKHHIAKVWVADCGDPYMLSRFDSFRKPFYFKYLEDSFCRKCDYISIPFSELQEQFYPQYRSKMRVIPQGFNFNEVKLSTVSHCNKELTFIFSGSVIPGVRDLNLFFDYISNSTHEFIFVVYTNQPDYYRKYKDVLGNKLELRDYVDRLSLIFELSKADFLINVDTIHDSNENIEAIPSKLIDYSLSNRPILNINSANLDEENIDRFFNKDYSGRRIIDKERFNIEKVANKFLELTKSE